MRILMLIQWCHPEPDFKCIPMARALRQRGHTVEVLTGFPNYPGGRVYPGYRIRPWQREIIDGIPVVRVALYPSHDSSALRRAANYASFALSSSIFGPWLTAQPDVVYAYNPMGLPALVFQALKDVPFVYDIQDLWPEGLFSSGMLSRVPSAERAIGAFFKYVYRRAAHLVVLSDGLKRTLVARGVAPGKITVVHNWTDESANRPMPADAGLAARLGLQGRINVVYAGNIGRPQSLAVVLRAAARLRTLHPAVLFTLVGGGTEREPLRQLAAEQGLDNVQFLPRVAPAEAARLTAQADALLVHLRDDPLFQTTIPSKIQAYLAMGKPLLAGVRGDARELVERSGAGLCFDPDDGDGLAAAVDRFCQLAPAERARLGQRAQDFYRAELSIDIAARRYEEIFLAAARQPPPAP